MTARNPEPPRISTAFLLSQVGARSAQMFAELLAPLHFLPADAGILRLLDRVPGISQQDLARRLNMHASRLVAVIDALEERGLVARQTSEHDRRTYSLQLTGAGRDALGAIGRVARAHEEAMCAGLNDSERSQLTSTLQKIAARQKLSPGIHPGYRTMGARDAQPYASAPRRKR
jgi:DNA-binding MarR family transcriptional regulator